MCQVPFGTDRMHQLSYTLISKSLETVDVRDS